MRIRAGGAIFVLTLSAASLSCSPLTGLLPPGGAQSTVVEHKPGDQVGQTPAETPTPESNCPEPSNENLLLQFPRVQTMTLLTPTDGGGPRPLLSWSPVAAAEYYGVVLYDEGGRPYWAWQGEEVGIYVGGIPEPPPENTEGPVVFGCMTWTSTAYNADGVPIAAGGPRSLSP